MSFSCTVSSWLQRLVMWLRAEATLQPGLVQCMLGHRPWRGVGPCVFIFWYTCMSTCIGVLFVCMFVVMWFSSTRAYSRNNSYKKGKEKPQIYFKTANTSFLYNRFWIEYQTMPEALKQFGFVGGGWSFSKELTNSIFDNSWSNFFRKIGCFSQLQLWTEYIFVQ